MSQKKKYIGSGEDAMLFDEEEQQVDTPESTTIPEEDECSHLIELA